MRCAAPQSERGTERRSFARRETQPCQQNATSRFDFLIRIHGNPKTTLRIATDISEPRICPFLILAVFGFPLNTPLPTRHARSPVTTAQSASSKSAVIRRGHHRISPKRGWARWSRKFIRVKQVFSFLLNADSWQLENRLFGTPPLNAPCPVLHIANTGTKIRTRALSVRSCRRLTFRCSRRSRCPYTFRRWACCTRSMSSAPRASVRRATFRYRRDWW